MELSLPPSFEEINLFKKSFEQHEVSYLDLTARALVEHTIFKLSLIHSIPPPVVSHHYPDLQLTSALTYSRTLVPIGRTSASTQHTPSDDTICIIGAGVTGLYTAMLLDELGIDYDILEANNRVGGRILTHRFNGDLGYNAAVGTPERYDYYDVGAMRFPRVPFMESVFQLFETIGIESLLIPYTFHHQNNVMYYNHRPPATAEISEAFVDYFNITSDSQGRVPSSYTTQQPAYWTKKVFAPFRDLFVRINNTSPGSVQRAEAFKEAWKALSEYDHLSTRGYMQASKKGKPDGSPDPYPVPVVHWLETMSSATGLYDQGFIQSVMVRFYLGPFHPSRSTRSTLTWLYLQHSLDFDWPFVTTNSPPPPNNDKVDWFCVDGGTDHIVREMVSKLKKKPELKRQVVKIEEVAGGMLVTVRNDDGKLVTRNYKQVISTVPLGCLQTIDTDNVSLSYSQREAIRGLNYDASTKMAIKFEKRWWQDPDVMGEGRTIEGGQSSTDLPIRVCVYPSYGVDCPNAPGVLLVSYTWSQDARRLGSLARGHGTAPDQELLEIALSNLEKLHGVPREKFGNVLDHHVHAWYNDPYTRGAFAHFGPGQFRDDYKADSSDSTDDCASAQANDPASNPVSPFVSLKAPDATVRFHIAGEATSVHHGWVLGGLNSAWRAVFNALTHYPKVQKDFLDSHVVPSEEDIDKLRQLVALARAKRL